jgi:cytochrome b6-f complex iron-sulfur subunit
MADEKSRIVAAAPEHSFSRRQLVRGAALVACAPTVGALIGCGKRVSTERDVTVGAGVDGNLVIPRSQVQELDRAGGAVILHSPCAGPLLLANTGSGILAMGGLCPHANCELAWVQEDRQAECPCHGSRFAGDGTLLSGPATSGVQAYPASVDASGSIVIRLFAGDNVFPAVANNALTFDLADPRYQKLQTPGGAVVGHPDGSPIPIAVTRPMSSPLPPEADGGLVAMSALCTHLTCTLQPTSPTTLRCPCHGSEFLLDGTVQKGPAISSLLLLPLTLTAGATPGTGTVTIQLFPTC